MSSPFFWSGFWPTTRVPTWDSDIIALKVVPNSGIGTDTQIDLMAGLAVTWWKGIFLLDHNGNQIGNSVETIDDTSVAMTRFTQAQIAQVATVDLRKAKSIFAVATGMYAITTNLSSFLTPGTELVFSWLQDRGDAYDATFTHFAPGSGVDSWTPTPESQLSNPPPGTTPPLGQMTVTAGATFTVTMTIQNGCPIDWDPNPDFDLEFFCWLAKPPRQCNLGAWPN